MAAKEAKFRGHLHFPFSLGGAGIFDKAKLDDYHANNASADGGWYPIGANQTWHNGIHLDTAQGNPIYSIARGRIIAARLGTDYSTETHPFGSPRFVLVQHDMDLLKNPTEKNPEHWQTRNIQFYSLYMHLDCQLGKMEDVPWLQSFLPFMAAAPQGALARVNVAEDGLGAQKGLNARSEPTAALGGKWTKGEVVCVLPKGTIVERCAERKGSYQKVNVPAQHRTSLWVYDEGNRLVDIPSFTEQVDALRAGGCVKLDYPIESGECLGHAGLVKPAWLPALSFLNTYGIHLEVFSASNLIASEDMERWHLVEDDTDDDSICEYEDLLKKISSSSRLTELLKRLGWDSSEFTEYSHVKSYFHSLSDEDRQFLRGSITHNTSYWSIDWKTMAAGNKAWVDEFEFETQEQEAANRYSWWRECESKGVVLPARNSGKALVYHYHPLVLMQYVDAHLPPPPIFFVKRSNKEYVVNDPTDILLSSSYKEAVWVYEPGQTDWLLGKADALQGCIGISNVGETSLYAALINPADAPGIPSMSSKDKHIWASIWRSEGDLEAINSYDSAFLSFGPIQQTMGTPGDKGELQGALNYVKTEEPQLFKKYFGKYHLDVVELDTTEGEPVRGHVKLESKVLKSAAEKQVLREFIWAYHCVKAMADERFRRLFLIHGFKRIDIVGGLIAKFGGTPVRLSDVYKMELSLALLLDVHINLPSAAKSIWVKAVKNALGLANNATLNTSSITRENEYKMIKEIIALRNASNMWSPSMRAACIVLCARGLNDALAQKLGYEDVDDIKSQSQLHSPSRYAYDFLEHTR